MWVKDVLRFCYLNIPWLRINSTLIFMSSSNDEVTYFEENSKTDAIAQAPCFGKGWKNCEETGSRGDVFGVRTSTPVENHFKKWVILIAFSFVTHSILGFHMTSPKFKLRNYRLFWVSEFHEVLQHLNTFIWTKFWFERVLRLAKEDVWSSRLLRDVAFSWRPGRLSCGLKTLPILWDFAI